ncbi:MAG: hypothetical protein U5K72_17965 [Balneolaceae bacterium]|nr:hypothetical protein [Balneolaceae bacterium]
MAQKVIPFEPGHIYHVYHHANGDDLIFRETENYFFFLSKIEKYIHPISKIYAYCLMPNHFHFLLRVKKESVLENFFDLDDKNPRSTGRFRGLEGQIDFSLNISKQFKNCLISYAKAYNKVYERKGSLFSENLKRIKISQDDYFANMIRYIHFNPVIHGFTKNARNWSFSSYRAYLSNKNSLLERDEVFEWFGGEDELKRFHLSVQKDEFEEISHLIFE